MNADVLKLKTCGISVMNSMMKSYFSFDLAAFDSEQRKYTNVTAQVRNSLHSYSNFIPPSLTAMLFKYIHSVRRVFTFNNFVIYCSLSRFTLVEKWPFSHDSLKSHILESVDHLSERKGKCLCLSFLPFQKLTLWQ